MMLDPALKANSEAMPVKTKGIIGVGNMMKYEFGIYKVIKAGQSARFLFLQIWCDKSQYSQLHKICS